MHNGVIYATNVMNALIKADPDDAADIRHSGERYIQQLQKLDSWAKSEFAGVAQSKRKVLTSHDAFGYFGQRYGVTFLAPVGSQPKRKPAPAMSPLSSNSSGPSISPPTLWRIRPIRVW